MESKVADDSHLDSFYAMIGKLEGNLGGKAYIRDCRPDMELPRRGVYFMFEDGQYRMNDTSHLRVTRVGKADSSMWDRLHDHQGTAGGGSMCVSVLRRHVGTALKNLSEGSQSGPADITDMTNNRWLKPNEPLKKMISDYIGAMRILWLSIDDEHDRDFVETNSIRLLSNMMNPVDIPSLDWLGRWSHSHKIRRSGLWNVNFVTGRCDLDFLKTVQRYI